MYKVNDELFEDWTDAQDKAVQLLDSDVEWVTILQKDGLLQQLNLEQGVMPDPIFSTASFAPYYVQLRDLNYER